MCGLGGGGRGAEGRAYLVHQTRVDDEAPRRLVLVRLATIQERRDALASASVPHRQHAVGNWEGVGDKWWW